MGSASMSSVTATLLGKMTDIGFYHQEGWIIYAAPLALIGVTLGFAICTVMSTVLMAKVSQAVLVKLRMQLFESILHWPEAEYQRNTTGRISSKFVNEATMALSGAAQSFIVLVRDSIQVVALLSVLFWHDWQLTLGDVRHHSGTRVDPAHDFKAYTKDREGKSGNARQDDFASTGDL